MEKINGLKQIISGKKALICDLWGVLHNGKAAFEGAIRALEESGKRKIFIVLLSNSPKPAGTVRKQIEKFGLKPNLYNAIVTSGDLAREFLKQRSDKTFFFLGPERDLLIIKDLPNARQEDLRRADYVLCTGFFEEWGYDPEQYVAFLSAAVEGSKPFICANPDLEVVIGDKRVLCAGTLARVYETLGGKVYRLGKPEEIAYWKCFEKFPGNFQKKELLAIGDNLETDISGAKNQDIENVFITSGLHGRHGHTKEDLAPFLKTLDIWPDYFMTRLDW